MRVCKGPDCGAVLKGHRKNRRYCSHECAEEGARILQREYQREIAIIAKERGKCNICFGDTDPEHVRCIKCRLKWKEKYGNCKNKS